MEMWLFQVVKALEIIVATKAWKRLDGFLKKNVSWNLVSVTILKGHLIPYRIP